MKIRRWLLHAIAGSMVLTTGCSSTSGDVSAGTGVVGGVYLNHDRRTTGAIVDDQAVSIKANLAISKDKELWRQSHINTLCYNGTLLLVGQTPDHKSKAKVDKLLADIPEISKVYNQLTIGPVVSAATRMQDSWITTQVKTKIVASREVGPNRVKVVTEDSKVHLMGALTADEAETVADLARNVKGVDEVVTIFEDAP